MARMIPEHISEETKSSAERKLFNVMQKMDGCEDWTILHSLMIANHISQSQGEADFVVVIPNSAILVLEVKGGRISEEAGTWFSTDKFETTYAIKNPISEANNAMFSIMEYVRKKTSALEMGKTIFGFGIVFPDVSVHGRFSSVEIADQQIADCDDCLTSNDFQKYLIRLAKYWKEKCGLNTVPPSPANCKTIVNLFRQDFHGTVSRSFQIKNVENQLVELTENQMSVFDTISENDRCLVKGSAGTGKTIIALNYAKKLAEEGNKVAVFCYNKKLAEYLKANLPACDKLVCDSFTEYMDSFVSSARYSFDKESDEIDLNAYYKEELPLRFIDLFSGREDDKFDCLVIDEAQDIMHSLWLETLDAILKGGLKNGKWCFFADQKQTIFQSGSERENVLELIDTFTSSYTKCSLKDNCRNSVAIIEKIDSIFGTKTKHKYYDEPGAEVEIRSYRKPAHQADEITKILQTLEKDKVPKKDIVILSPVRFENSAAHLVTDCQITTDEKCRNKAVYFSTIQSFKGLESSVVIVIDLGKLSNEGRVDTYQLLYVAMTRAKSLLYLLAEEKTAQKLRSQK